MADRPEPGLIKWSPNPDFDSFIHINLQHRVVQVYEPTGHAQRGRFDYKKVSKHDDFPPLTTYDWSPSIPGLVAVGTSSGTVNLLRVDDSSNAYLDLPVKHARPCQAVAFSTTNLLAVGLERVRNEWCLNIWDTNRLSNLDSSTVGFPLDDSTFLEPVHRLEPTVSVSSIKFFEDSPQTLVVGIKNQGVRIHDLRDPNGSVITFQTKCNNNLAIDYADQNYFASSTLEQPSVMIWDRRVSSRPSSSPAYLEAVDADELPWGGALRLEHAIERGSAESKDSLIRSLRYCRDQRGQLGILAGTGQLKIVDTQKEFATKEVEFAGSPELLHVSGSYEMDFTYGDLNRKNDRIVSFDWVTTKHPALGPKMIILRANGTFDIFERSSYTTEHVYKMVPWNTPYRGLETKSRYHGLMQFETNQSGEMHGSLLTDDAMSSLSLFGSDEKEIENLISTTLNLNTREEDIVIDMQASLSTLPELFTKGTSVAEKLRGLRNFAGLLDPSEYDGDQESSELDGLTSAVHDLSVARGSPPSNRELHEKFLLSTMEGNGFPKAAQILVDHVMLLRAREKYLFDFSRNRDIVSDDPWLRDLWDWVSGAEEAAAEGGMRSGPLDLSYLGAWNIWSNDLGRKPSKRLADSPNSLNSEVWERCLQSLNKNRGLTKYQGADTKWPHHRLICMQICGSSRSNAAPYEDYTKIPPSGKTSSWHTMATAHALFEGDTKKAVQILKRASSEYPELLFVSLALQLISRGDSDLAKGQLDFDDAVASKTDPYLRAISSYIATGDWEIIANQESLPLRERTYIAFKNFDDVRLTQWLEKQVIKATHTGDIEGIVLTGITDRFADILAKYIEKFGDVQTATLIMSVCAPRYIDDSRCVAWRTAYRAYLQRHKAFFHRTKFEVESTKRSKRDGRPTIKPPSRQIALRCVYCDAEYALNKGALGHNSAAHDVRNPLMVSNINAGVSCPNCGRHLPRCVVCLEVVGIPRSDRPELSQNPEIKAAARFPTFCLKCEHVLHLDHARQWFARHLECPVPECRCRCNFRANPELNYH